MNGFEFPLEVVRSDRLSKTLILAKGGEILPHSDPPMGKIRIVV